tara:strand:- start:841 stop:1065 length:225 start_codon:yes stop_codon:yes gene_type:complete
VYIITIFITLFKQFVPMILFSGTLTLLDGTFFAGAFTKGLLNGKGEMNNPKTGTEKMLVTIVLTKLLSIIACVG